MRGIFYKWISIVFILIGLMFTCKVQCMKMDPELKDLYLNFYSYYESKDFLHTPHTEIDSAYDSIRDGACSIMEFNNLNYYIWMHCEDKRIFFPFYSCSFLISICVLLSLLTLVTRICNIGGIDWNIMGEICFFIWMVYGKASNPGGVSYDKVFYIWLFLPFISSMLWDRYLLLQSHTGIWSLIGYIHENKCPKCGKNNKKGNHFCENCGYKIDESSN